jgi:hypothetical protein
VKAALRQIEINPLTDNKGKGKEQEEELVKVSASAIRMAITLDKNLLCLLLLSIVLEFRSFQLIVQKSRGL